VPPPPGLDKHPAVTPRAGASTPEASDIQLPHAAPRTGAFTSRKSPQPFMATPISLPDVIPAPAAEAGTTSAFSKIGTSRGVLAALIVQGIFLVIIVPIIVFILLSISSPTVLTTSNQFSAFGQMTVYRDPDATTQMQV